MKTILTAAALIVVLNLLGVAAFAGWLVVSGRVDEDRLQRVVDLFRPTIDEERRAAEAAEAEAAQAEEEAAALARIARIERGGGTLTEMLDAELQFNEHAHQQLAKLREERRILREQMDLFRTESQSREQAVEEARAAFAAEVERQVTLAEDEDFLAVVATLDQLDSAQVKGVFEEMLADGQEPLVIDYLAAMKSRPRNAVLGEFEGPQDITTLNRLLDRLRQRRSDPLQQAAAPAGVTP